MRQYQVPQFIDIEDKIIGPLTIHQFLYFLAAGVVCVMAYYTLTFILFIIIAATALGLAAAFAIYKVDGVPFSKIALNAIDYFSKPRLYLWKQLPPARANTNVATQGNEKTEMKIPTLTESKLQDLAWSLDIKEKME